MKTWLPYILIFFGCLWLSSCENNVEMPDVSDEQVSVHLNIAFTGSGGQRARVATDDFDYTTEAQNTIDVNDLFVLVFDGNTLLDRVDITNVTRTGSTTTATTYDLEGRFLRPGNGISNIEIVILANLKQNNIDLGTETIDAYINGLKGTDGAKSTIYSSLIYNYDGTGLPWKIEDRRIPMWGSTKINVATNMNANCNLHRAVAKVGIWVNNKEGIKGFTITKIEVKGAMDRGYCVSQETPGRDDYYTNPSIPFGVGTQNIEYSSLNVDKYYENEIYLPEQKIGVAPLTIKIYYLLNERSKSKDITFSEDVIRNHSYIYNITSVTPDEVDVNVTYEVVPWDSETIEIPKFN